MVTRQREHSISLQVLFQRLSLLPIYSGPQQLGALPVSLRRFVSWELPMALCANASRIFSFLFLLIDSPAPKGLIGLALCLRNAPL